MNRKYKEILLITLNKIKEKGYCTRKDILFYCNISNSYLSKLIKDNYLILKDKQ